MAMGVFSMTPKLATGFHCRWMIRRDVEEIIVIEREQFTVPWQEDDFVNTLRQRNTIGKVVEASDESIAGYIIYELHKSHLEIVNLAVSRQHKAQGVASLMIGKLMAKLHRDRRTRIIVKVSDRNLEAQLFFKRRGFKATEINKDAWGPGWDGYTMVYELMNDDGGCDS